MDKSGNTEGAAKAQIPQRPPRTNRLADLRSHRNRFSAATNDPAFSEADDDDQWTQHPLEQHVMVHEAGHAIFALDHDIPFQDVLLRNRHDEASPDSNPFEVRAELRFAGEDRSTWAGRDPEKGFRFAFAGMYAEMAVLGEPYPEGAALDLQSWCDGVNVRRGASDDEVDKVLGRSQATVLQEVDVWASRDTTVRRVERLAEHFTKKLESADSAEDPVVTYAEVVSVLPRV